MIELPLNGFWIPTQGLCLVSLTGKDIFLAEFLVCHPDICLLSFFLSVSYEGRMQDCDVGLASESLSGPCYAIHPEIISVRSGLGLRMCSKFQCSGQNL